MVAGNIRLLFFIVLILPILAMPQEAIDDGFGSDLPNIPPLQQLIDSALVNSPLMRRFDAAIELEKLDLSFERRQWLDYLYVEGNTRYGVYDQIYFQGLADGVESPVGFLNQRRQAWYYGGVSIKLPISTFINQKKRLQQTHLSLDIINHEKEMMADELQKSIIEAYYTVLFRYESMNTFYAIYQDLKVAYRDAQNRLEEQKIGFNDYAILSSTYGKAKNDWDQARSDFLISLNLLRFMTGWDF